MEPVFHGVSLLQAHWKDMNQSMMTACYISDQDSDSNNSDFVAVQDSGNAVPSIPFTPIGNHDPAKQLQRAKSAMRRHYYRCSATLFKKVAEMTSQTGWTGFLVLRSPDGGQYLYGGKWGWLKDLWLISPWLMLCPPKPTVPMCPWPRSWTRWWKQGRARN